MLRRELLSQVAVDDVRRDSEDVLTQMKVTPHLVELHLLHALRFAADDENRFFEKPNNLRH
jgi:hypothetical protein